MKVLSVNVGRIDTIRNAGRDVRTGIFKPPVDGPVYVSRLRLAGDVQADLRYHGGLNRAVYGYRFEHYASWAYEFGSDIFPYGEFGEDLTTEGLLETQVSIGDLLRIGTALLQVSEPREPCYKLEAKMRVPGLARLMHANRRCGF